MISLFLLVYFNDEAWIKIFWGFAFYLAWAKSSVTPSPRKLSFFSCSATSQSESTVSWRFTFFGLELSSTSGLRRTTRDWLYRLLWKLAWCYHACTRSPSSMQSLWMLAPKRFPQLPQIYAQHFSHLRWLAQRKIMRGSNWALNAFCCW